MMIRDCLGPGLAPRALSEPVRGETVPPPTRTLIDRLEARPSNRFAPAGVRSVPNGPVEPSSLVREQRELEHRANLPALPLAVSPTFAACRGTDRTGERLLPRSDSGLLVLQSQEELVVDLLDRFHAGRKSSQGDLAEGLVALSPLDPFHEHWHIAPGSRPSVLDGSYPWSSAKTPPPPDDRYARRVVSGLVQFVNGDGRGGVHTYDISRHHYLVGNEFEAGIYYDVPGNMLASRGVALRQKAWSRGLRGGVPGDPTSWAAFVKVHDGNVGAFTARRELTAKVDAGGSRTSFDAVAAQLLRRAGLAVDLTALSPVLRIDNHRYVVDVVYTRTWEESQTLPEPRRWADRTFKIGFLTVDAYAAIPLAPTGAPLPLPFAPPRQLQMEVEILPEHQQDGRLRALTESLIGEIHRAYGAETAPAPKVQQGMAAVAAALRAYRAVA